MEHRYICKQKSYTQHKVLKSSRDRTIGKLFFFFSETGSHCIALAGLELTMLTGLASNAEIHLPRPPKC